MRTRFMRSALVALVVVLALVGVTSASGASVTTSTVEAQAKASAKPPPSKKPCKNKKTNKPCKRPPPPPPASVACSDDIDNDVDGRIDYPDDPGCIDEADDDETDAVAPPAACADGADNDGDGKVDYPADPGCADAADGDETDAVATPPASYSSAILNDDPWGYWRLEDAVGSTTIEDASPNNRDGGIVVGWHGHQQITCTITSEGSNTAWLLSPDGAAFAVYGPPSVGPDFSLEAWIRLDRQLGRLDGCAGLFNAVYPVYGSVGLRLSVIGHADPWMNNRVLVEGSPDFNGVYGPDLGDGAWHHFALVRDTASDRVSVYFDGVAAPSDIRIDATNNDIVLNPNPGTRLAQDFYWGNWNCTTTGISLDEAVIYEKALTAAQVGAHAGAR